MPKGSAVESGGSQPVRKENTKEKKQEKKEHVKARKENESATPSNVPER